MIWALPGEGKQVASGGRVNMKTALSGQGNLWPSQKIACLPSIQRTGFCSFSRIFDVLSRNILKKKKKKK